MIKQLEELVSIKQIPFTKQDKEEAARLIKEKLDVYSVKMGVKYDSFSLSSARKRWGVCRRRADIRINYRLAKQRKKYSITSLSMSLLI